MWSIVGFLLAMATVATVFDSLWGKYIWIDHSNYPGGPLRYYAASQTSCLSFLGITGGTMSNILTGSSCAHISLIGYSSGRGINVSNTTVDSCINAT